MIEGLNGILRQVSDLNKHIEEIKNKPNQVKQEARRSVGESLPDFADVLNQKKTGSSVSLDDHIQNVSRKEGVDESLVRAVIETESNFDPEARSEDGAVGLMQLMPETARKFGVSDPENPRENVRAGVKYLGQLMDDHDSLKEALAAYNAGPGAVEKYDGVPPFDETQNYVKKVLSTFRQLKESGTTLNS
ncbi:MAG: lytic transglycosylase domain-containing protein [bacterium]